MVSSHTLLANFAALIAFAASVSGVLVIAWAVYVGGFALTSVALALGGVALFAVGTTALVRADSAISETLSDWAERLRMST